MKINLKNARRLESKLQNESERLNYKIQNKQNRIKFYVVDNFGVEEKIKIAKEEYSVNLNLVIELSLASMAIRSLISAANKSSEIDNLIHKQAETKMLINILEENCNLEPAEEDEISNIVGYFEQDSENCEYQSKRLLTSIFNEDEIDKFKDDYLSLRNKLENLQDECSKLNIQLTITLPSYVVNLAKDFKLI